MELWHVPFSKHWAVLDTNARHVETLLLLISERRSCRTLHFWQRPCGPVPIMWFTPSKQVSGNCDMHAHLSDAVRSDCTKLRTTCRQSSKWLCGLPSTKQ
ncbi:2,3-bisphosphoglycerate-dependent phosphoglycerate mutase [Trichinella spiralis]|uniref:2,3-bisphosphoglycerate-dependent phosphoglycerate mutase n=1 Tax=Trichinella spiralis TaxID=6334 RepID=A0ABR3L3R7_TRISP